MSKMDAREALEWFRVDADNCLMEHGVCSRCTDRMQKWCDEYTKAIAALRRIVPLTGATCRHRWGTIGLTSDCVPVEKDGGSCGLLDGMPPCPNDCPRDDCPLLPQKGIGCGV